jgi:hypothetical protein
MPHTTKVEVRCPVKLTQAQRKVVAEIAPELADRLKLDETPQRTLQFTVVELQAIKQKAETASRRKSRGVVRNSLRHVTDLTTQAIDRSHGILAIPASERVYQFKITLNRSQPPIWRRIQVKNCTLDKLHEHIQTAMGWTNSHLHDFRIDEKRYGDPVDEERSFHHSEDNFVGAKFLALPVDSVNTGFVKKLPSAHAELKIVTRR